MAHGGNVNAGPITRFLEGLIFGARPVVLALFAIITVVMLFFASQLRVDCTMSVARATGSRFGYWPAIGNSRPSGVPSGSEAIRARSGRPPAPGRRRCVRASTARDSSVVGAISGASQSWNVPISRGSACCSV